MRAATHSQLRSMIPSVVFTRSAAANAVPPLGPMWFPVPEASVSLIIIVIIIGPCPTQPAIARLTCEVYARHGTIHAQRARDGCRASGANAVR